MRQDNWGDQTSLSTSTHSIITKRGGKDGKKREVERVFEIGWNE